MKKLGLFIGCGIVLLLIMLTGCTSLENASSEVPEVTNEVNAQEDERVKADNFVNTNLDLIEEGLQNLSNEAAEATTDNKERIEASYNEMMNNINTIESMVNEGKDSFTPNGMIQIQDKIKEIKGIIQAGIDTLEHK